MTKWQLISKDTPHDRRLLVWAGESQFVASWCKNLDTGDERFTIADLGDGDRLICNPTKWQELPEPPEKEE